MDERYVYLAVLVAGLVATAVFERASGVRVWWQPKRLAIAAAPVVLAFAAWHAFALARTYWFTNPRYVSGASVGSVPVEDLMLFTCVSIAAITLFEAIRPRAPR